MLSTYLLYIEVMDAPGRVLLHPCLGGGPPLGGCFEIDVLGVWMTLCVSLIGFLVILYSIRYMEGDDRLAEFYSLILLLMAGMTGVVLAGDLFTLFIFWELACITSYVLVAFTKGRWASIEAAFKYLIMSSTGSMLILLTMSFLYGMTGTLNLAYLSLSLKGSSMAPWLYMALILIIVGFGIEAAIVPLHTWLPDAYSEAPYPISALLSGIHSEIGLYALCRLLFLLFDLDVFSALLSAFAILTMTVGNIMALLQDDIKRLLSYSCIAQIGYMLIGLAVGTMMGLTGTFSHIFNNLLMKGLAFLSAGVITYSTGKRSLKELRGVGRSMPLTTLMLAISFLGLMGVPTTNGFISKFLYLFRSTFEAGMAWLGVIGIANSVFSVAYYLRVLRFLLIEGDKAKLDVRPPPSLFIPMLIMAFLVILFGVWPTPVIRLSTLAARSVLELENYIRVILEVR